ncbi:hypothetical protein M9H77_36574 [Catharanthus roseus]|uniref:Uncharacterized protein n=1 Tax=Catharanthus roseus TaxID=4058 RepID=A0ACB9ZS74_CATRO|nr:hypothetical protein M9H77_36574 [Catharanthus roseus]
MSSIFEVSISSILLVHINALVLVSECLALIRRKRVGLIDTVIFMTKIDCLFFIYLYGQDIEVKLFKRCQFSRCQFHFLLVHINALLHVSISSILLVHINALLPVSECIALLQRKW